MGIARCASPWACPLCSPVIGEQRAGEIDRAVANWLGQGGGVVMVSLTCRHHQGDELAPRLAVMSAAMEHLFEGGGWRARRDRLGYVGSVRAVEVTDGRHGWHPHTHALLFVGRPLSAVELRDLEMWLYGRWGDHLRSKGFGSITLANGVDVRPVRASGELGGYLTKVEGGWGTGLEMARGDLKRGRAGGAPAVQHLRDFAETGEVRSLERWTEYERATKGKRCIRWSKGLRALLLGDEPELSDLELAAAEGADETLVRFYVTNRLWLQRAHAGRTGEVLEAMEQAAAEIIALEDALGGQATPLGPDDEGRWWTS
jgi:hypothetical protein